MNRRRRRRDLTSNALGLPAILIIASVLVIVLYGLGSAGHIDWWRLIYLISGPPPRP